MSCRYMGIDRSSPGREGKGRDCGWCNVLNVLLWGSDIILRNLSHMSICLRGRKGGFSSIHQLVDVGGGLFRYSPLVHYKVDVFFFAFLQTAKWIQ